MTGPETEDGDRPISRAWACLFSGSIIALLWVMPMEKTRKWVVVALIPSILFYFMAFGTWPAGLFFLLLSFVWPIFFMYRWTTAYNIKYFGHANKADIMDEWRNKEAGLES